VILAFYFDSTASSMWFSITPGSLIASLLRLRIGTGTLSLTSDFLLGITRFGSRVP
jgi:hypothetical protein